MHLVERQRRFRAARARAAIHSPSPSIRSREVPRPEAVRRRLGTEGEGIGLLGVVVAVRAVMSYL